VRRLTRWGPLAILVVVLGGVAWVAFGPKSGTAPRTAAAATPSGHQRCQPLRGAGSGSNPASTITAADWTIEVAGVRVASSIPHAGDAGEYRAEPGRRYVVVDLAFRRRAAASKEASISSSAVSVTCQDGMTVTPSGWKIGTGFCVVCGFDMAVDAPTSQLTFALKLDEAFLDQPFELRYEGAGPIRFTIPTSAA
jgi:hypothetical protein